MGEWRLIETAPELETVTVWTDKYGSISAQVRGSRCWTVPGNWLVQPTHWMPRPEGPAEDRGKE